MRQSDSARAINVASGIVRRTTRAMLRVALLAVLLGVLVGCGYYWRHSTPPMRYRALKYGQADLILHLPPFFHRDLHVRGRRIRPESIVHGMAYRQAWHKSLALASKAEFWALWGSVGSFAAFWLLAGFVGRHMRRNRHLRGASLTTAKRLALQLKLRRKASQLKIGKVPLVKGSETQHFLVAGTTGAGKSVMLNALLDQIRAAGDRAVIYDKGGDLLALHYRDGDHILNPLDARSARWTPWAEMPENDLLAQAEADRMAATMVPTDEHTSDAMWPDSARIVLGATLFKLREKRSISELRRFLLSPDTESLVELVHSTEAAAILGNGNKEAIRTVLSVLITLVRKLPLLRYLDYQDTTLDEFSISKWVETGSGWLYLTSKENLREALKPLLTTWIDTVASSILSQRPNRRRRIWIIVDEAANLGKMPSLPNLMAEGRKYGACVLLGYQSISQIREEYGQEGAKAIVDCARTRIIMALNSPETADWASKLLGTEEIERGEESYTVSTASYHGMNVSTRREQRRIVLPDEIMSLPNHHLYIRLPGSWPVAKTEEKPRKRKEVQERFIPHLPSPPTPPEDQADPDNPEKPSPDSGPPVTPTPKAPQDDSEGAGIETPVPSSNPTDDDPTESPKPILRPRR